MRWLIPAAWVLSFGLWGNAATAASAERPLPPQVETQRRMYQARPLAGKYRLGDLVSLSLEGGRVKGVIHDAARQAGGDKRVEIEDMEGDWQIMYTQIRGAAAPADYLQLMRYDFEEARRGGLWSTRLYLHSSGTVSVIGNAGDAQRSVTLSMTTAGVRLIVRDPNAGPAAAAVAVNVLAPSIEELRSRCPKEVRQYVRPMLAKFMGPGVLMVKAADAYRAFPEIKADAATVGKLGQILPQLDAPLAEERDKASKALAGLGERGVLAVMRMDRSHLTPEQNARLEAFVARHDEHRFADAEKARRDAAFLIECLECADPAVRAAAKGALGQTLGRAVDFDVDATAEARAKAVDGLWEMLGKVDKVRPTTQGAWREPVN